MAKETKVPNVAVEAALSVLRWVLIFVIANNALWAAIHFGDIKHSPSGTQIKMIQDGTGNTQSVSTPGVKKEI